MHPKELLIADYSYPLSESQIAKQPLAERDLSKLLIYNKGTLLEDRYLNLAQHLEANSLIVFNQSKVVPVRLYFQKETGAQIEVFCLGPDQRYPDMSTAMTQKSEVYWQCLVGGAQKWKQQQTIYIKDTNSTLVLEAHIVKKKNDYFILKLCWNDQEKSFAQVLQQIGEMPLPPYMKRKSTIEDIDRYQTIYALKEGSVAAPTAGLHFTDRIFKSLEEKNIHKEFLHLHVGAGTFKPVKTKDIGAHEMHAEWIEINLPLLKNIEKYWGKITAVGTTTMRCLESIYWIGLKLMHGLPIDLKQIAVLQWDPYDIKENTPALEVIQALIQYFEQNNITQLVTQTQIIIAPSYQAKIVNQLISNFHQPNSTLLVLIAALIGEDWKKMYQYALAHQFRFLSYGDGCLLKF